MRWILVPLALVGLAIGCGDDDALAPSSRVVGMDSSTTTDRYSPENYLDPYEEPELAWSLVQLTLEDFGFGYLAQAIPRDVFVGFAEAVCEGASLAVDADEFMLLVRLARIQSGSTNLTETELGALTGAALAGWCPDEAERLGVFAE